MNLDRLVPGAWALTRTAASAVSAPVTVPALTAAAMHTARRAALRIDRFGEHLHAVAEDRPSPLPAPRTLRLPGRDRYVITSDLHRCGPGALDWPAHQRTDAVYPRLLEHYAEQGWHLIENGDVEDLWMTGGSASGAVYDVSLLATGVTSLIDRRPSRSVLRAQLDRIVENNAEIYGLLRDGFCADGRYHRTVGNHDDALTDDELVEHLATSLPGLRAADTILLDRPGATAAEGIAGVRAVIAHGHLTDSWNGPGFAALGRVITWLATAFGDLPWTPSLSDGAEEHAAARLLAGRGRNRLISVDARYGGNRRFDSLDEERLFERLGREEPDGGWPWLLFGHTHFPMLEPLDASGRAVRYANSGCGVMPRTVTALEWDPADEERPVRVVAWTADRSVTGGTGVERVELRPDGRYLGPV